jgi:tRNA (cmo5U34)-methyltransferase
MASPTQTSGAGEVLSGHWWKEADRVADYVARNDQASAADEISSVFGILTALLPFEREAPIKVLDIGSGHGVLAAAILDAFPGATAIGLDISEPMMAEGRKRMARFGSRFSYHVGDFAQGTLPSDLTGPFDLVVSSRAIHHLQAGDKKRLFTDIRAHLNPGGAFFNVDNMRQSDEFLRKLYRQVPDPTNPTPAAPTAPRQSGERPAGGREHPDPVEDQLVWMREAGFVHVDVFWKRLGRSMVGGFKES